MSSFTTDPLVDFADQVLSHAGIATSGLSASPACSVVSLPDSGYGSSCDTPAKPLSRGKSKAKSPSLAKAKLYQTPVSPFTSPEPESSTKKRSVQRLNRPEMRAKMEARAKMRSRREILAEKASKMNTVMNSPVNEFQFAILRMVFDKFTPYPPEAYMNIIGVMIGRSFRQIKNWFSNERQKCKVDPSALQEHHAETGELLRLREPAVKMLKAENHFKWTDDLFEELITASQMGVLLYNMYSGNKVSTSEKVVQCPSPSP